MSCRIVGGALVATATLVIAVPVYGEVCTVGQPWYGTIDVVVEHGMENEICKDGETPCTTLSANELISTVKDTLNVFHENTAADIHLRYAGWCYMNTEFNTRPCRLNDIPDGDDHHPGPADIPPYRLVIHAQRCFAHGYGYNFDTNGNGYADKGYATICTGNSSGPKVFGSYPGEPDTAIGFQGILLHELGHAVGFGHVNADTCGTADSMMSGSEDGQPTRYDIAKLHELYGVRDDKIMVAARSWLLSPGNWTASGTIEQGDEARSRFTACDVPVDDGTLLAATHQTMQTIFFLRHASDGTVTHHSWIPSYLPDHVVLSSREPGLACRDANRYRVLFPRAFGFGESEMFYSDSTDGGLSWSNPQPTDNDLPIADNEGVEASWDPASGRYIYAHRTDNAKIVTHVMSPDSSPTGYARPNLSQACNLGGGISLPTGRLPSNFGTEDCWRAADTPTLACGDPARMGEYNCMLAWTGTNWERNIHYARAKVIDRPMGGQMLELENVRNLPWSAVGSPSLAIDYHQDEPWVMSYHDGGTEVKIMRAAPDPEWLWSLDATYEVHGPLVTPTLGTYNAPFFWFHIPGTVMVTNVDP